jgi:hypothetical protein
MDPSGNRWMLTIFFGPPSMEHVSDPTTGENFLNCRNARISGVQGMRFAAFAMNGANSVARNHRLNMPSLYTRVQRFWTFGQDLVYHKGMGIVGRR